MLATEIVMLLTRDEGLALEILRRLIPVVSAAEAYSLHDVPGSNVMMTMGLQKLRNEIEKCAAALPRMP